MQARALEQDYYDDDVDHRSTKSVATNKPMIVGSPGPAANSNVRPKRYKAFFKHLTDAEKSEFKTQRCIVLISIGQPYHEGKKLEALLKLVDRSFASCTIVVADSLQRHSLEIEYPTKTEGELEELAKQEGREWVLRNSAYIDQLSIPHNVSHWQEWTTHTDFHAYKSKIEALYTSDKEYRDTCHNITSQFVSRRKNRNRDLALSFNVSKRYLIEESTVFCLWPNAGYDVEVYPCSDVTQMINVEYICTKLDTGKKCKSPITVIQRT